jgi:iron complex outermembrane recepter protein
MLARSLLGAISIAAAGTAAEDVVPAAVPGQTAPEVPVVIAGAAAVPAAASQAAAEVTAAVVGPAGPAVIAEPAPATAGVLHGRVTDPSGAGVAAVEIALPEVGRMTLTQADGSFRFTDLAPGPITVALRRIGYRAETRTVTVSAETVLDFTLAISPFAVEPVIVTATPSPLRPDQSNLPTAVLSGDRLRRDPTVSLSHAVEQLPGVHSLSTGAQVGKPVIRGLTGARVLVLDDSRRLEDYSWSDEDGPAVDAGLTDRVEVIRGPASILYGSEALGGVVNAVPRALPEAPAGSVVMRGALEVYGASNNREVGSGLRLEGAKGGFGWRVFGIGRGAGDLHTPDGPLQNTGFFAVNGEAMAGLRGPSGNVTLRYARYGGEFKLLEAEGPPAGAGAEEGPERKLADDRLQLGAATHVGGVRLQARGQWQRHNLIEVADEPGSAPGSGKESEQFNLLLNTGTLELMALHDAGRFHTTLGVSGMLQSNDSRGPIPLVPDAGLDSGAIFGLERIEYSRWAFLAGARGDFAHLTADRNAALGLGDQSRSDAEPSANAGVVYSPVHGLSLSANVGRAWRAPTLFELYANGPHVGEMRYEVGDPDLVPEHGANLDGGLRWESRRVVAEVAGFRNAVRDFIYITPTDELRDSLRVYRHVQGDAVLAGGELGMQLQAHRYVTVDGRLDYVWGENEELHAPLPLMPPARAVFGATLQRENLRWAARAAIGLHCELGAAQKRLSEFDTPTDSYALLHLDARWARRWAGRDIQVGFVMRNLANVSYRDYLSRYKDFALDQGRNVLVRVSTGL